MTDFRSLPGVPNCCPLFERGTGREFLLGAMFRMPLFEKWDFDIAASYITHNAHLTSSETAEGSDNGNPIPLEFEHRIDAHFASIDIEPTIAWRFFGHLSLVAGGRLGFLVHNSYSQLEQIVLPTDRGVFLDSKTRTRNENAGEIPDLRHVGVSMIGGFRYTLPLTRDWSMAAEPEILVNWQFTNVVSHLPWTYLAMYAGVRITFGTPVPSAIPSRITDPEPTTPQLPSVVAAPTSSPTPPALMATVSAVGVNDFGDETQDVRIVVEEFVTTRSTPLLSYVFFDEDASIIPARYDALTPSAVDGFRIDTMYGRSTLDICHEVLNIIGLRMHERPMALLTLTGCNDGSEKGGRSLSRARAEAVKAYLCTTWEISPSRILVHARDLPDLPSDRRTVDGSAENRRVELHADDWEVLAPVTAKGIEEIVSPPIIRFRPRVEAGTGLQSWSLLVMRNTTVIKTMEGTGLPGDTIDWTLPPDGSLETGTLNYLLAVADNRGRRYATDRKVLPVNRITIQKKRMERMGDREIERSSLILFDYDDDRLDGYNAIIAADIRKRLKPESSIVITGHTDRMGDAEHNRQLSHRRAANTARTLGRSNALVKGCGVSENLFDNNLPEGRFYCRTVNITIETPVK